MAAEISHYVRALPCHYQTQNSLIHFTALHAVFSISICRENCIPTAAVSHQTRSQWRPYAQNCKSPGQPPLMAAEILVTFQWQDHTPGSVLQTVMLKYLTSLIELLHS